MNPFVQVSVTPTHFDGITITWRLDPGFSDIGPFYFTVEAGETPELSDPTFRGTVTNTYFIVDDTKVRQNAFLPYYTRVTLTTGSGKQHVSRTVNSGDRRTSAHKFNNAREIIRREYVLYRTSGQACYLLKRKNYGEIDEASVSVIGQVSRVEASPTFGTPFSGGFYPPMAVMTWTREVENVFKSSDNGTNTEGYEVKKCRTSGFPYLMPKDVLVMRSNLRYNIEGVQRHVYPGSEIVVAQTFIAKSLPMTDPIYRLPVPELPEF